MTRNHHLAEDDTAPTQCLPDAFPFSFKYGFFCTCLPLEEALTTVPPEPTPAAQQPPWYVRSLFGKRKTAAADATIAPQITISSSHNSSASVGGHESAFNSSAALVKPQTQELLPFDDWLIVFVLGGPGSGKGTQCAKLVEAYGLVHISTGDLLREEVALGTELGREIRDAMEEGKMVSNDVIRRLLLKAMESVGRDVAGFLIDGFPRTMEQAIEFENHIGGCNFVLYYECPAQVLIDRLVKRGETSGRVDDNPASIEKRIHVFERTSLPVIEYYMTDGRVQKVNGNASIEEVTAQTFEIFDWVFSDETQQAESTSYIEETTMENIRLGGSTINEP